jgi:hypothetical protein
MKEEGTRKKKEANEKVRGRFKTTNSGRLVVSFFPLPSSFAILVQSY